MISSVDLELIGNCRIGALIDAEAEIVWYCVPRFDGDPAFCSLLREHDTGGQNGFTVVVGNSRRSTAHYSLRDTDEVLKILEKMLLLRDQ